MTNWALPTTGDTYANYTAYLLARDDSAVKWMDSVLVADSNFPTGAKRWNATNFNWEKWSGSAWGALATLYGISISGNAATATTAAACSGNAATATTAAACSGNAATATAATTATNATQLGGVAAASYAPLASPALTGTPTIGGKAAGFKGLPAASVATGAFAAADAGKCVYASGGVTVPNSTMAAEDVVTILNTTGSPITITATITTLRQIGSANTGNRTLAGYGLCSIVFTSGTLAFIGGTGLT